MEGFRTLGFPRCVGAIEASTFNHLTTTPGQNPISEVLLQATVDHSGRFVNAELSSGIRHTSPQEYLRKSVICAAMDAGKWIQGNHTREIHGIQVPPVIVADRRFLCRPWLMTPYAIPVTQKEIVFNASLNSALTVAKSAIKRLCEHWRCLTTTIRFGGVAAAAIVSSCVALDNIIADPRLLDRATRPAIEVLERGRGDLFMIQQGRMIRWALAEHIHAGQHL